MKEMAALYIADGRKKDISSSITKKYQVQYNPAEITVSAGEPMKKSKKNKKHKLGTDRKHKVAEYETEQYSIRVTIPLTFDNSEKYIKDLQGGMAANENDYSVRTEVEGFVAMLKNPNIRHLTFSWGAICYMGELVSMSGQYTMFTKAGTPVRATLSLTMKCKDFDRNNQWMGMYSQAFSNGKGTVKKSAGGLNKALLKISKAKFNASTGEITQTKGSTYTLEAEYNPSSISVSSQISRYDDDTRAEEKGKKAESPPASEISFQLIFDSTDDSGTDVACVTNGLISLMTDKALTEMELCWGDMSFKGHISGIQAKFTMFSEDGIPMRSLVDVSLSREAGEDKYWDTAFDRLLEKRYGSI